MTAEVRAWPKVLALVGTLVGLPGPALAFHEVASFDRSANSGGGAGSYYTGSPRFKGYDCRICHLDTEERISIELSGGLESGTYQPGLIYDIRVRMIGEHRGLDSAFNPNTFTADITDGSGAPIGVLSASSASIVEVVDDNRVAVAEGFGEGETEWSFAWFAPSEPVAATLHIAMLDGDGASDGEVRFIDPLNDDVATMAVRLCPVGQECPRPADPEPETSPAGCTSSGGDGGGLAAMLLVLLLAWRTRTSLSTSATGPPR